MAQKQIHVIGNGDKAVYYKKQKRNGLKVICNMPPFAMEPSEVYATCMVDFKMMMALTEGSLNLDMYQWVLGSRPRMWMDDPARSTFYLKYAHNIKEFYTKVPDYAGNATNFNCGHMAVHYAASKKPEEIHMYGFDTLFDFNMNSVTDLYLNSDRGQTNNYRLINNWRPVWMGLFAEFPNIKFVLHHDHADIKIPKPDNVEIVVYDKDKKKVPKVEKPKQIIPETDPLEELRGGTLNRHQRRAIEAQKRKRK